MKNKECIILNKKELKNFFELFNDNDTFKITIREELNGVELYTRVKLSKKNDIIKTISYINDCFKIDFKNDIIMTYFINDFKRVLKIRLLKSDLTNKKIINLQTKILNKDFNNIDIYSKSIKNIFKYYNKNTRELIK